MAEHQGDKVKRGFLFYVFMFVLILFAAFLVLVMIMLFSPGTKILGLVYFNFEKPKVVTQTTDTEQPLSFDTISQIVVNSTYANVRFSKSTQADSADCIRITNTAKGFAKANQFVDFEYSVTLTDGTLNISVKEPEAFLYFSKNIEINVCVGRENKNNLNNCAVKIGTGSGSVTIGNNNENESAFNLHISDLTVATESGNITITHENGAAQDVVDFGSLMLSTNTGTVNMKKAVKIQNNAIFSVRSKGRLNFENIEALNGVQLVLNNGKFFAKNVTGNVAVTKLESGSIDIEKIAGSFDTNQVEDKQIKKASIKIGEVNNISIPFGNAANINIAKLIDSSIICTTSGNITISQSVGTDFDIQTTTGKVDLVFNDTKTAGYVRDVASQKGSVKLTFVGSVRNIINVRTNGSVEIALPQNSEFTLNIFDYAETPITKLGGKLTISFVDKEEYEKAFPFKVNFQQGDSETTYQNNQIFVYSNSKIRVHL